MFDEYKLLARKSEPSKCPLNCCAKFEEIVEGSKPDILEKMAGIEVAIRGIFNEKPWFEYNQSRIAFVTFRRLQDATEAGRRTSFFDFPASSAPKPENVYFMNASVSRTTRTIAKGFIFFIMLLLVLFWSIPVGFFQ